MSASKLFLDRIAATGDSLQVLARKIQHNAEKWDTDPKKAARNDEKHPLLLIPKVGLPVIGAGILGASALLFGAKPGTLGQLGMGVIGLSAGMGLADGVSYPFLNAVRKTVSPVIDNTGQAVTNWARSNGATPPQGPDKTL